jgi:hypothetical protein
MSTEAYFKNREKRLRELYKQSFNVPQSVVPYGGTTGQVLKKSNADDYVTEWGSSISIFHVGCASGDLSGHDGDTLYFGGATTLDFGTVAALAPIYIPYAGTITRAYINWLTTGASAGSNENLSMYFRLNNTSDTLIETIGSTDAHKVFNKADMAVAVIAGDYFEIKIVCPSWATNPDATHIFGVVAMTVT